ncbi:uncharacterized protein LOC110178338 [Drosophila serrata]|uniref:uncharacterized protein LOC110178338 n=1 Tax=Drosophila serrata TaxID=7274 RepID=UPI000A1CF4AF|nr:uncharacterized protein LOC110178338 [Drosophila serrata]
MKFAALIISFVLIVVLTSQLEARLLLSNGNGFFCLWTSRKSCSKSSPRCLRVQTDATPTYTCKYYRNECQYLLDNCKGATVFGQLGTSVDVSTYCVMNNIGIGSTGICT